MCGTTLSDLISRKRPLGLLEMPANGTSKVASYEQTGWTFRFSPAAPDRRQQVLLHVAQLVGPRVPLVRVREELHWAVSPAVRLTRADASCASLI